MLPFGMLIHVGPMNHLLDLMQMRPREGHFWGVWPIENHRQVVKYSFCGLGKRMAVQKLVDRS